MEASLLFPAVFFATISFLFLTLVVYQKVTLHYLATVASDGIAYTWNNSYKEPYAGEFEALQSDGLYWRLSDDRLLGSIFELRLRGNSTISVESSEKPIHLTERKLHRIVSLLPKGITGTISYDNRVVEVTADLESPLGFPDFIKRIFGETLYSHSRSTVIDPVEFNRNIELARDYYHKWPKDGKIQRVLDQQQKKENRKRKAENSE